MTARTFVPWAEPVAAELRETRAQIVALARSLPDDAWTRPSPCEGWSYRDLLVHLAVGDWVCQKVLTFAVTNTPLDHGETESWDWIADGNAQRLEERKDRPIDELVAEVESEGEETQELLARLADADASRAGRREGVTLGDYLRGFPGHDRQHLDQLRTALDADVMSDRSFAPWVEPVALRLRDNRTQVLEFARAQPEMAWATRSGLGDWTCKDVLAHMGKGNDQLFQKILRHAVAGEHVERSTLDIDTDGDNARGVEARRDMPAADVIAEFAEAGEEVHELLSRLTLEHEQYRQDDPPFILASFMEFVGVESHDLEHLTQIRAAMAGRS